MGRKADYSAPEVLVGTKQVTLFLLSLLVIAVCSCAVPSAPSPPSQVKPAPSQDLSTSTPAIPAPRIGPAEKWIEVDLAAYRVRLREGNTLVREYPCATGAAISRETTTFPGVYRVQQMIEGPIENVPGVFVSDILIYDLAAGAGIHSMPMDKDGKILDETLGKPVTAGCVRVKDSNTVFKFARVGTTIWIH